MAVVTFSPGISLEPRVLTVWKATEAWDAVERLSSFAQTLGVAGDLISIDESLCMIHPDQLLQVFTTSNSMRWHAHRNNGFGTADLSALGGASVVIAHATQALATLSLLDGNPAPVGEIASSHSMPARVTPNGAEPDDQTTQIHVYFRYRLNGIDTAGPGAKARVTFEGDLAPVSVYRFWRPVQPLPNIFSPIALQDAMNSVAAEPAYTRLDPANASVVFNRVRYAHYALPPFISQKFLVPIIEFSGVVSTQAHANHAITKRVLALSDADASSIGIGDEYKHFDILFLR